MWLINLKCQARWVLPLPLARQVCCISVTHGPCKSLCGRNKNILGKGDRINLLSHSKQTYHIFRTPAEPADKQLELFFLVCRAKLNVNHSTLTQVPIQCIGFLVGKKKKRSNETLEKQEKNTTYQRKSSGRRL